MRSAVRAGNTDGRMQKTDFFTLSRPLGKGEEIDFFLSHVRRQLVDSSVEHGLCCSLGVTVEKRN
jgi:hypothetical protein